MRDVLVVLVLVNLGYFVYDDLKTRTISLYGLIVFFTLGLFWFYYFGQWVQLGLNVMFLTVWLSIALLFVRYRKNIKLPHIVGLGDILFLYIVALFFDFPTLVISLNTGLVFSLIIYLFSFKKNSKKKQLIPLAGLLAIVFGIAIIFETYVQPIHTIIYGS